MKIYVAGASAELERCERMIETLRARGHEITEDWPRKIRRVGLANQGLTPELHREAADADVRGVANAQTVVILVPKQPNLSQGCWWEGGVADALDIPIIAAGRKEDRDKNIFLSRAEEVDEDDEVFGILEESPARKGLRAARTELFLLKRKQRRLEASVATLLEALHEDEEISAEEREDLFRKILAGVDERGG